MEKKQLIVRLFRLYLTFRSICQSTSGNYSDMVMLVRMLLTN